MQTLRGLTCPSGCSPPTCHEPKIPAIRVFLWMPVVNADVFYLKTCDTGVGWGQGLADVLPPQQKAGTWNSPSLWIWDCWRGQGRKLE